MQMRSAPLHRFERESRGATGGKTSEHERESKSVGIRKGGKKHVKW